MYSRTLSLLAFLYLAVISMPAQAQHRLEELWHTDPVFSYAVGVTASPDGRFLYVSNTIGNPVQKDGKGSISKVGSNGKIIQKDWLTGLNAPKDIRIFGDRMYVADLDEVLVVDMNKAAVMQRIPVEGAQFLHNLAVDAQGTVYVSDMFQGRVHRIKQGKAEMYLEGLPAAAGVLPEGPDLYVLSNGQLLKIDSGRKRTTISEGMDHRMNGLQQINGEDFLVTSWGGIVYYVHADGTRQELLNTISKDIPAGIICYDEKQKILYMTSDQHNVLYAYRVK
ncbi:MAG: ATP/GTP-binding protein [Mucilaginibacter polytrichastri]|nr:ATP/GTP-binding protein [Mucilaginibacter polytrichastri]